MAGHETMNGREFKRPARRFLNVTNLLFVVTEALFLPGCVIAWRGLDAANHHQEKIGVALIASAVPFFFAHRARCSRAMSPRL